MYSAAQNEEERTEASWQSLLVPSLRLAQPQSLPAAVRWDISSSMTLKDVASDIQEG